MQTFAPYSNIFKIAKCLDYKRLGKQRVEVYQILDTLLNNKKAWANHPAVKMWEGYENFLLIYGLTVCTEWTDRGYKDNMAEKILLFKYRLKDLIIRTPEWWGLEEFHASHRSNLLRKFPEHYSKFGWTEPGNLPYFWPTKNGF